MIEFVRELSRRRVFRGGATYFIFAWIIWHAATAVFQPAQNGARLLMYFLIAGGLLALVFSYVFQVTDRSLDVEEAGAAAPQSTSSGRLVDIAVLIGLGAVGLHILWLLFISG